MKNSIQLKLGMYNSFAICLILLTFFVMSFCQFDKHKFEVKKTLKIDSDGVDKGKSAYDIFKDALGPKSIESPDMFEDDHDSRVHIVESHSDKVGDHFVFALHLNKDGNRGEYNGTQRNEIKVYNESREWLRGEKNSTFRYKWKFKVDKDMKLSDKFCHFFQLHSVGTGGHPMITLSGNERNDGPYLEVTYTEIGKDNKTNVLGKIEWEKIRGKWLKVACQVTFSKKKDGGSLIMSIVDNKSKKKLLGIKEENIDLWYDGYTTEETYIRPKWGVVRSIESMKNDTNRKTEKIRFANFRIESLETKK